MGCHICNLLGLLIALLCYWEYVSSFGITYFSIRLWKCYFRYRCQQFISKINGLFFIKWDKFSFRIRTFCHIMSNLHFHLWILFFDFFQIRNWKKALKQNWNERKIKRICWKIELSKWYRGKLIINLKGQAKWLKLNRITN